MTSHAIAPMSKSFLVMTGMLLLLPFVMLATVGRVPEPAAYVMYGAIAFMVLLYALVWLWWRPSRFELGQDALVIHWPLRQRAFPYRELSYAELTSFDRIHQQHGQGLRVGAGGLFGAFGRYVTKKTTLLMYVTRMDRLVLVAGAEKPLIISPADPEDFVVRLSQRLR